MQPDDDLRKEMIANCLVRLSRKEGWAANIYAAKVSCCDVLSWWSKIIWPSIDKSRASFEGTMRISAVHTNTKSWVNYSPVEWNRIPAGWSVLSTIDRRHSSDHRLGWHFERFQYLERTCSTMLHRSEKAIKLVTRSSMSHWKLKNSLMTSRFKYRPKNFCRSRLSERR